MLNQLFCLVVYVVICELKGHVLLIELTSFLLVRVNGCFLIFLDFHSGHLLLRFYFDGMGLILA